jgi:subtilisin family serine protease
MFFTLFAQNNTNNKILVYFKNGIKKIDSVNEQLSTKVVIVNKNIKLSLQKLGLDDSMIEIANPQFNEADTLTILPDGTKLVQLNMTKLYSINVPKGKSKQSLINELNKLPDVLYAESDIMIKPLIETDDARYDEQWALNTINAEDAWNIYEGNPNSIIAIIDGGVDVNHIDLVSKISGGDIGYGWNGHGIHVAGIAAAISNNGEGIAGVDRNALIHSKRIDNISSVDIYNAIVNAVNYNSNVNVLNHSWGNDDANIGAYSTTLAQAFAYAYKANRTSVVAMGNHQITNPNVTDYPAGFNNVIAVGSTNITDIICNFSAVGNHIDVCAPGENILSTDLYGSYNTRSGTSMATPHVSGIASLLKGYKPNLSNDDIENIICLGADKIPAMNGHNFTSTYGYGRVNANNTLEIVRDNNIYQWTATGGTDYNSSGYYTILIIGASNLPSSNYVVKRHEVRKTITFPLSFNQIIGVWGRGIGTTGWRNSEPNYGEGFCEVLTHTNTNATLRTYVYEITNISGQQLGWFPTSPSNVTFAYTVLGTLPPTISGASSLYSLQQATYTVQDLPTGTTVTWSGSSNVNVISGQGTNQVTISACSGYSATITATLSGTINQVLNKTIEVKPGDFYVTQYLDHVDVELHNPYAQCFDWEISNNLISIIGNGNINCSNYGYLSLTPEDTEGYIAIRARKDNCYSNWRGEDIHLWRPQIAGNLEPMRSEPFYASLVENSPPPNYASYGNIEYFWYFDDNFIGMGQPYIQSWEWSCGEHTVSVIVNIDGYELSASAGFYGMCTGGGGGWGVTSAAYPNPANNELIIDKIEETATNTQSIQSKQSEIRVLLYSHSTAQLVYSKIYSSSEKQIKIDTSKLPNGIYHLNIIENGEKVKQQTIIINH